MCTTHSHNDSRYVFIIIAIIFWANLKVRDILVRKFKMVQNFENVRLLEFFSAQLLEPQSRGAPDSNLQSLVLGSRAEAGSNHATTQTNALSIRPQSQQHRTRTNIYMKGLRTRPWQDSSLHVLGSHQAGPCACEESNALSLRPQGE